MITRIIILLISIMFTVPFANAQPGVHTSKTGGEVLRLIRNEKLDLILPEAMRDNNVDMWIHVTREGDPDPLEYEFGSMDGYLIFTDRGDRIERAMFGGVFGGSGAVENIDVRGSIDVARAISGYDYGNVDFSVYDEITEFVTERDPQTIAVNFSDWLAVADGISYTQYLKLEKILGPKYSQRIVSAERLITDFRSRRILREVTAQTNALEMNRQIMAHVVSRIKPGMTTIEDVGWMAREEAYKRGLTGYSTRANGGGVLYSAVSDESETNSSQYVLKPGDFFAYNNGLEYMDFGIDTKFHVYICREGETRVPESLQYAYDKAIAGQWIMRPHVRVGMTAGESLEAIVKAMEGAGYIYTPFTDIGSEDDKIVRRALANTDKSGFSVDLHVQGNNGGSLVTIGPSMAPFRRDRDHLVIQENHIFAYEYMVHTNLPERPGNPISINISNPQIVSSRGIEWLQPPNEEIVVIH